MKKVVIYSRVSTSHQDVTKQQEELTALCQRAGWEIVGDYSEKVSGRKSVEDRPVLKQLMRDARQRRFDQVVVWSVDRLGRSMRDLVVLLEELNTAGIDIYAYKQDIDTSTPTGKMFWNFLGIFSEFENDIRKERQRMGIDKAKARGVEFGRPKTKPETIEQIVKLRKQGMGKVKIGRIVGAGTATVSKVCAQNGI